MPASLPGQDRMRRSTRRIDRLSPYGRTQQRHLHFQNNKLHPSGYYPRTLERCFHPPKTARLVHAAFWLNAFTTSAWEKPNPSSLSNSSRRATLFKTCRSPKIEQSVHKPKQRRQRKRGLWRKYRYASGDASSLGPAKGLSNFLLSSCSVLFSVFIFYSFFVFQILRDDTRPFLWWQQ